MGYNLLNISGGATKMAGLLAKCERVMLDEGFRPDVITGVSAGALLTLPIVLDKWDLVRESAVNAKPEDIFDKMPFNKKGKVSLASAVRVLFGAGSLGTQNNLYASLKKHVSASEFRAYQRDSSMPRVIIGATNYNTGRFKMFDAKKLQYEDYLRLAVASSAVPVVVEAVKYDGSYWYDGGVCHTTCSVPYLTPSTRGIKNIVSIYSRPADMDTTHKNFNMVDLSQVVMRTMDIMHDNVSLRDEREEKLICASAGINLVQTFCPSVLTSMYDTDPARLRQLYDVCRNDPDEPSYERVLK